MLTLDQINKMHGEMVAHIDAMMLHMNMARYGQDPTGNDGYLVGVARTRLTDLRTAAYAANYALWSYETHKFTPHVQPKEEKQAALNEADPLPYTEEEAEDRKEK